MLRLLLLVAIVSLGCGAPPEEPERWTASAQGFGPVSVGMTKTDAASALHTTLAGPAGINDCTYLRAADGLNGVLFMEVMGQIVRIDFTSPGIATAEGIDVGTDTSRVFDAYGSKVTRGPHKYTNGEYLTIAADATHRIVFETDQQRVTRYRVGRLPEVEWVEGCS